MNKVSLDGYPNQKLSEKDFSRLSEFIYKNYGIKMPREKRTMLEGRLTKRLRAKRMSTFSEYCDYVFSPKGMEEEVMYMINVVSTNKTDFFREPAHFEFLYEHVLPEHTESSSGKPFRVWSAASSSGEEAYTIALLINEYNRLANTRLPFSIFGTDISSDILEKALLGIYREDRIATVPSVYKQRYFMVNKDPQKKLVRVVPELRKACSFMRLNLIDPVYPVQEKFDAIFCRNVLIYFDRPTQEAVINKLCNHLVPGGYFFLGHSESTMGMDVPLKSIRPSVFKKK